MKRSTLVAAIGGSTVGLAGATAAVLAARRRRMPKLRTLLHRRADELSFEEIRPGVTRAVIWGDPDRGPHAAFVRFAPGVAHPLHTHAHDLTLVVLSGAYLYKTAEQELRVCANSFVLIPGGLAHESGGDPQEGALFYEWSPGAFDLTPV